MSTSMTRSSASSQRSETRLTEARPAGRTRSRRRPSGGLWMLPFLAFAVVFGAYPFAQVVRMAFSSVDLAGGQFVWSFQGPQNFTTVLSEAAGWDALANTVVFVVSAVLGSLVAGTALALLVDRAVVMLPVARNLLIWPAVVTPVVISLMWLLLLSPTAGGINKVLGSLGLPEQAWLNSGRGAMVSVVVVDVWHWTPVVFLFVYTALKGIDGTLLEAGRMDGAGEGQLLRRVVLPLLAPAIGAVALVRVVMSVKAFDEMFLLTAGGPDGATTLVSQHIRDLFFVALRFGDAAAYGLVVVALTVVALVVSTLLRRRPRGRR